MESEKERNELIEENNIMKKKSTTEKSKNLFQIVEKYKKMAITVLFIICAVAVSLFLKYALTDNPGKTTTVAESSLSEILAISELSTVEYIYNSTVTVRYTDKYEVRYYVAYEGKVTMGVDFNKVDIHEKSGEDKVLEISLPAAEVQGVAVDIGTLDFIFTKEKENTETVVQEAYQKCVRDLENKAKMNRTLKESAGEEAKDAIRAILEPLALREGYQIQFTEEVAE